MKFLDLKMEKFENSGKVFCSGVDRPVAKEM